MKFGTMCKMGLIGLAAGAVNGLFGAGGGMLLVPLLTKFADLEEQEVFAASVSIIFPICLISVCMGLIQRQPIPEGSVLYLAGSAVGGFCAGKWGTKIPTLWLHRILGIFILWGGIRYLC